MKLNSCFVSKFKYDEKNSVKRVEQSTTYPGHEAEIAIDIYEIHYEAKTSELKKLKIGMDIEFYIDQEIILYVPNYRNKEDDEVETYVNGEGSGTIVEIQELNHQEEDEEYQEVRIVLSKGYAEQL